LVFNKNFVISFFNIKKSYFTQQNYIIWKKSISSIKILCPLHVIVNFRIFSKYALLHCHFFKAHWVVLIFFKYLFSLFLLVYPGRESNPDRWDGNPVSNNLDHPDSLAILSSKAHCDWEIFYCFCGNLRSRVAGRCQSSNPWSSNS